MKVKIGVAPDSWGVIFPEHEKQPPAKRVMREMAEAGYQGLELGPWGFFPNTYSELKNELDKNGLELVAGTVRIEPLNEEKMKEAQITIDRMGELLVNFPSARYVVLLTDVAEELCPLTDEQWKQFCESVDNVYDYLKEKYNLIGCYHSYAGGATPTEELMERFLADTHADMCLDTGHFAIANKDVAQFYRRNHMRIPYIHLKDASDSAVDMIHNNNWSFIDIIKNGLLAPGKLMVEPGNGEGCVNFDEIVKAMEEFGFEGWVTVEQDMFPLASFDDPLPVATRTNMYFRNMIGI